MVKSGWYKVVKIKNGNRMRVVAAYDNYVLETISIYSGKIESYIITKEDFDSFDIWKTDLNYIKELQRR